MRRKARDRNVRKIEFIIRHEKEIRVAVAESRLCPRGHTGGAPSGHSYVSDPTAAKAIRQADELDFVEIAGGGKIQWPERWLAVVDAVRAWCASDAVRAGIFKRWYSGEGSREVQKNMGISESTYRYTLSQIRDFAVTCAAQAQVVRVF